MTTAELNQYLENIAKLIEATAKDPEDAATIVRDSKVKENRVSSNSFILLMSSVIFSSRSSVSSLRYISVRPLSFISRSLSSETGVFPASNA